MFAVSVFADELPKQIAKKTDPVPVIREDVKRKLLVYQSKLNVVERAIEASPMGKEKAEITAKFQAILSEARDICKGGDPVFGVEAQDGDVICSPVKKETAKADQPKPKE